VPDTPESSADSGAPVDLILLEELLGEPAGPDNEWISMFVDLFPPALDLLINALDARDRDQLHDAAHAAKGAAGSIAATMLMTCLQTMEHTSHSADWDSLERHAETARSEFERIVQFNKAA
jgi:HPt (histidine-containing phosphotransfer) domain-containing protein